MFSNVCVGVNVNVCVRAYVCVCVCETLIGPEHQSVNGGAGPEDIQGPTVYEEHGDSDESGGRKVEGGVGKSPWYEPKGLSGKC